MNTTRNQYISMLAKFAHRLVIGAIFGLTFANTHAHADMIDDLLDKLKAKGILTEPEHPEFKHAREAEKAAPAPRDNVVPA